ncbi:M15 family metallopeptidase [Fulvivirgaceae bacterium BMA12]|uniref:D-alanyl-D-alanine dipeptidase n=1 Tax=Agaribacillus aureus TaxID=3051825 RepID=A0ABT8L0Q1_9BACT|nr:M15 family metallopeptidase [Fulvivirgaceae bacterium BMA12]
MMDRITYCLFLAVLIASCQNPKRESEKIDDTIKPESEQREVPGGKDGVDSEDRAVRSLATAELHDSSFVFIEKWSDDFVYDMKYATTDNFIGKKVYDCDQCMIRKKVALALMKANRDFMEKGYRIKFFDCYRPLDVQKIMWEVYPVEGYVANPYTSGSIHNRGGAVDITLVDNEENELDMGTGFDHFGEEAHHAYRHLPEKVLGNRKLLKDIMEKHGFKPIRTEWWHYNFGESRAFALSNFPTKCD